MRASWAANHLSDGHVTIPDHPMLLAAKQKVTCGRVAQRSRIALSMLLSSKQGCRTHWGLIAGDKLIQMAVQFACQLLVAAMQAQ